MMRCLLVVAIVLVPFVAFADDNFCMDCIQSTITHDEDPENIWFETDGMCCMMPCAGYEGYEVQNPDVGAGCSTRPVNGVARGDICDSETWDQGCPPPPPPPKDPIEPPECPTSPIILDLGSQAYRLTSASDGVSFDIQNNGTPQQISWTRLGVENAFLALDRNGNGRIDNGAELFGNFTPLRSGGVATNGFEALRELDENGDGQIDASDPVWNALVLWTDRNHDGASTADELQAIASSIVTALGTEYTLVGRRDQWGNLFRYMAHFRLANGSGEPRRAYYDVFFRSAN